MFIYIDIYISISASHIVFKSLNCYICTYVDYIYMYIYQGLNQYICTENIYFMHLYALLNMFFLLHICKCMFCCNFILPLMEIFAVDSMQQKKIRSKSYKVLVDCVSMHMQEYMHNLCFLLQTAYLNVLKH